MPISPAQARAISGGLAAAAFAGAYLVASRRRPEPDAPPRLIDWDRVRAIAIAIARRGPTVGPIDDELAERYGAMVRQSQQIIANYTGEPLPLASDNVYAFDRLEWLDANIENFRELFAPIEELGSKLVGSGRLRMRAFGDLNEIMLSTQIGILLGYLSRRVLGQYDLAILGREPVTTGRLYFVQPNIAQLERRMGLEPSDFRLWIALHETTHAYEFESHPWLREHMNQMLQRYFAALGDDLNSIRTDVPGIVRFLRRVGSNLRSRDYAVELVMTSEQRQIFRSLQALMCLLEGYSNHVMDQIGRDLLPSYEQMKARFEDRQRKKSPAERLFARLTGLDVKLEQYVLGEKFVNEIVDKAGLQTMNRVWRGPEALPTLDEIRTPRLWLERVGH